MSTTTDLTTLKINYLTEAQYEAEKQGGTVNENELYMTPSQTDEHLEFRFGEIATSSTVAANSYMDVSVTFDSQMSGIPIVVCSIFSTSTAGGLGKLTVGVTAYTATGFTCRIFNGDTSARQPYVHWIAIYKA